MIHAYMHNMSVVRVMPFSSPTTATELAHGDSDGGKPPMPVSYLMLVNPSEAGKLLIPNPTTV